MPSLERSPYGSCSNVVWVLGAKNYTSIAWNRWLTPADEGVRRFPWQRGRQITCLCTGDGASHIDVQRAAGQCFSTGDEFPWRDSECSQALCRCRLLLKWLVYFSVETRSQWPRVVLSIPGDWQLHQEPRTTGNRLWDGVPEESSTFNSESNPIINSASVADMFDMCINGHPEAPLLMRCWLYL